MDLFLNATTNVPDLIIDFIEVKLKSGKTVSLNWERSSVTSFAADYLYLYFDEEHAQGRLSELEDMSVTAVGLYSETYPVADIEIEEMTFTDGEETVIFKNVFSAEGVSCDD